jgi:hypothetical protein
MKRQQRRMDEPAGSDSVDRDRGPGIGSLLFVTACGIGLGMLTAPAAGRQTRRRLGRQLATIGGEVAERWGEVHERFDGIKAAGARAGRKVLRRNAAELPNEDDERWTATESRLADLENRLEHLKEDDYEEEESGGGFLSAALGIAAGAGIAYFLMADTAEPARSKARQVASDVRRQATDRWSQFRRKGATSPAETTAFPDEE